MNTSVRKCRNSIYNTLLLGGYAPGKTEEDSLFPSDELGKIEKFDLMWVSCRFTKRLLAFAWPVLGMKNAYFELVIAILDTLPNETIKQYMMVIIV